MVNWVQLKLVSIMPPNPHSTPACPAAVNLEIAEIWILQTGPAAARYWNKSLMYCIVSSAWLSKKLTFSQHWDCTKVLGIGREADTLFVYINSL